jgi:uncharacterized protein (DUF1697 family)
MPATVAGRGRPTKAGTGRHVALLRGINVGRAKRMAMADLRALFEELGHTDVRTVLNSGNVVFTLARRVRGNPATQIEKAIVARFGFSSRVTVMSSAEVAEAAQSNPLLRPGFNPSRMFVAAFTIPADRARLEPLAGKRWAPDALAIGRRVAYLWCPGGLMKSRLAEAVLEAIEDSATTRNWATFTRLHDLLLAD